MPQPHPGEAQDEPNHKRRQRIRNKLKIGAHAH